jgi:uncharacterized protein (DUF2164 family)
MTIEISKEARAEALTSLERYFETNMGERIGNVAADQLLQFFLEEIGPVIHNRAVADVQERLQARVMELEAIVMEVDIEVHEEEFQYWRKRDAVRKKK